MWRRAPASSSDMDRFVEIDTSSEDSDDPPLFVTNLDDPPSELPWDASSISKAPVVIITQQPTANNVPGGELPPFQNNSDISGLEYFANVDKLIVKQKINFCDVVTGRISENQFSVKNRMGQRLFTAEETSCGGSRLLCGNFHKFYMSIRDNFDNLVIQMHRPFPFLKSCRYFFYSDQSIEVSAPPGNLIGTIQRERTWTCPTPIYNVKDAEGNVVYVIKVMNGIKGSCCNCVDWADIEFKVYSATNDEQVGVITKHWYGFIQEMFTNADKFSVSFNMDLDVKMKALIFSAVFLINTMFFERHGFLERGVKCYVGYLGYLVIPLCCTL